MCVCLFAVLLIYFGPLFSQISNALSPQTTTTRMSIQSLSAHTMNTQTMDMTGHNHAKMLAKQTSNTPVAIEHSHTGHHAQGESTNLLEACGYCSLLFHLNWIDAKTFDLIPLIQSHYPNRIIAQISHKHPVRFSPILPRAPPATSV
ncbi:DUF2946 domain-containing protein [Marinomonas profundi]|uniref:DUF2946 domain-containing protein n=1 Tax=Marinomonas profundi TaxID=2726122 RepID=UPI001D1104A8|nr:DUF2946 domain-containing protein [Marinomonas profundi]